MANPTLWGEEFLVNTSTASDQNDASLTTLADGRFIAVWTDASHAAGDSSLTAIRAQIFNADGTRSGSEILVNSIPAGAQTEPCVTALLDGGFAVVWEDDSRSADDPASTAIRTRIFTADGQPSTSDLLVNSATSLNQLDPAVATLTDGRMIVAWTDESQAGRDNFGFAVRAQILNADGSKSGTHFLVNTTIVNDQFAPTVAALADGRFVVGWTDISQSPDDPGSWAIRAQVFEADGSKSGSEFLVNSTIADNQYQPAITALANGNFVVTWTDLGSAAPDPFFAVRAQVFDATGARVGSEFLVNTILKDEQYEPAIAALKDGRFVIAWTDGSQSADDATGLALRAQLFNADGSPSGTEFLVNATTLNSQSEPTITVLADGRFVIGWTDTSHSGGDAAGSAVRGQIFDPREAAVQWTGSEQANQYCGTGFDDTLAGAGGHDRVHGGAGRDVVKGGAGDDRLFGNGGNDQVNGGSGSDILEDGAGRDTLTGGRNADIFVFKPTCEEARVKDFTDGKDLLDLQAFGFASAAEAKAFAANVDGDLVFTFADGDVLTLTGIAKSQISDADLIL